MTGRKFYAETEAGGTVFRTERKVGDVRIPNYVYDIWLPILGAQALGVYAVYCRLERQGAVKAMTQARLARSCRMGTSKLSAINDQLQDCGFVRIQKPTGQARLMHWTTEITVMDAPHEVAKEIKDKYAPPSGYEVLTPWLEAESPENLDGFSEEPAQVSPESPGGPPNIASLGSCSPLDVEKDRPVPGKPATPLSSGNGPGIPEEAAKARIAAALGRFAAGGGGPAWSVPAAAGGADGWAEATAAFLEVTGQATPPDKELRQWSRVWERVGAAWEVGPADLAEVIRKKPLSEVHWKTWPNPHAAEADVKFLLGQHFGGGIKPPDKKGGGETRAERNRRIAAEWRREDEQQWVDVDGVSVAL